jgi:hypothetical protein
MQRFERRPDLLRPNDEDEDEDQAREESHAFRRTRYHARTGAWARLTMSPP